MEINPRIPEGGSIEDSNQIKNTDQTKMEEYSEIMKKLAGDYIKFADNVISKVNPIQDSKVLEIGPGPGWAGIYLLKKRDDLTLDGLEASLDMIRVAEKNAVNEGLSERIKYIHGIAENMDMFPDEHYDLVISRASLHHWDEPERVFTEISRVLKSNGKLYIGDSRRDLNSAGKKIVHEIGNKIPTTMLKHWESSIAASYTPEEIKEMLNKIDFNDWIVDSEDSDLSIQKY
jgi:ubiquinone/menaquinone biosynthesis C-methylase UbiE